MNISCDPLLMTYIVIASLTENVPGGGHNHSLTKDSFTITRQQSAVCYDETSLSVLLHHKYIYMCVCVCVYQITHNTYLYQFIHSYVFRLCESSSGVFKFFVYQRFT